MPRQPAKPDKNAVQQALGVRVRDVRKAREMTQENLAQAAELHVNYVGSVERGERNIGVYGIARIAHALKVPIDALFQADSPIGR